MIPATPLPPPDRACQGLRIHALLPEGCSTSPVSVTECGSTRKDNADLGILERFALRASFSPQGIAFRLEQHIVGSDEQDDFVGSCVAWEGEPVERTADEALGRDGNKQQTAKADAVEFLSNVLAEGPAKAKDLRRRREPHVCWARLN